MFYRKLHRYAKGPISEGAVAAGDWGSFYSSTGSSFRPNSFSERDGSCCCKART